MAHAARRARGHVVELGNRPRAVGSVDGAVVDEVPRGAAVRRLVQPPLRDAGNRPRHARAADLGHAAQRGRGRRVDHVRRAGLDDDLADALAAERVARVGWSSAERAVPGLAAVGRAVDPDARDAAGATDVRLAGADVDRLPRRVVRVNRDRARGVDPQRPRQVLPVRGSGEPVPRRPDPAARRRHVEPAVARVAGVRDRDVRRATAGDVRIRDVEERIEEHAVRVEGLARADRHPRALPSLAARERPPALGRPRRARGRGVRQCDHVVGIRPRGECIGRCAGGSLLGHAAVARGRLQQRLHVAPGCRTRELVAAGCRRRAGRRPRDGDHRRNRPDRDGRDGDGERRLSFPSVHPRPSRGRERATKPRTPSWGRRRRPSVSIETFPEAFDELRVQAPSAARRGLEQLRPQLDRHPQQEAVGWSPLQRRENSQIAAVISRQYCSDYSCGFAIAW